MELLSKQMAGVEVLGSSCLGHLLSLWTNFACKLNWWSFINLLDTRSVTQIVPNKTEENLINIKIA